MNDTPTTVAGIGHNNPPVAALLEETHAKLKIRVSELIDAAQALPAITTPEEHDRAVEIGRQINDALRQITDLHGVEKAPFKRDADAVDAFFLTKGLKGRLEPAKNALLRNDGAYLSAKADEARKRAEAEAAAAREEANRRAAEAAQIETQGQTTMADAKLESAVRADEEADRLATVAAAPEKDLARTYSEAGTAGLRSVLKFDIDRDNVNLEALRPYFKQDALEEATRAMVKARGWKGADLVPAPGAPARFSVKGIAFREEKIASHH